MAINTKYIMVTNWENHWEHLPEGRTFFTLGMLKGGMNKDNLEDGATTLFIKKSKLTHVVEKAWNGSIFDFKHIDYKGRPAISFCVNIDRETFCPTKYKSYPEGWYYERSSAKISTKKYSEAERDALKQIRSIFTWWLAIKEEFGVSKNEFGRKINFVKGNFKRNIIFRDVEHAYVLSKMGFSKPAVILAGSVIEELLRLYLQTKKVVVQNNSFSEYIKTCEHNGFLKKAVQSMTTSVRHFRNLVHLENESRKNDTISRATATGAVTWIFTLINDF